MLIVALATAAPTLHAAAIGAGSIKAAWLFREGKGQTVRDWVSGHTGKMSGSTAWVAGRSGHAIAFSGGFVTVPEVGFTDSEPWTIAAWLYDESRETMFSYWIGRGTGAEAISVRQSSRDRILFRDKNLKFHLLTESAAYKNAWHHYAIVADGAGSLTLYVDGAQAGRTTNVPTQMRIARIGTSHARYTFEGKIESVLVFSKALTQQEIRMVMETPAAQLAAGAKAMVTPRFRRRAFSRDEGEIELCATVENVSRELWRGRVALDLDGVVLARENTQLQPGGSRQLRASLRPARFTVGKYVLRAVQEEAGVAGATESVLAELTVAPWRNARQFPLITWPRLYEVRWTESMRRAGITVLPFNSVETLDAITALGGYGSTHLRTAPVHPSAKKEEPRAQSCPLGSEYLEECRRKAKDLAERMDNHPTLRLVIVNTETWGELCFCDRCRQHIQAKFGIDPQELKDEVKAGGPRRHKSHFLIPKLTQYATDGGVVSEQNPLLRFAHWWWTEGGLNVGNQLIADALHEINPDIWTMTEPLSRFAPLRRYHRPMVLSCWSYPADPRDWIVIAPFLKGLARNMDCPLILTFGTLQLAGRLAPYTTTMPVDTFRLQNWLCLAHLPMGIQYFTWEITQAPEQQPKRSKVNVVHRRVCEEAVAGQSWEDACKKGRTLPQAWLPGIPEEIKTFSQEVVQPLGPLLRQAELRPARIGLLHSFTSALMSFRGWYYTFDWCPVARHVLRGPYAVDVVFEEEIEDRGFLSRYNALVLPSSYVLTRQIQSKLGTFIREGGTIFCGTARGRKLPGSVVIQGLDYRPLVKLHPTIPERVWDAPDARFGAKGPNVGEALRKALSLVMPPEYQSTEPDVLIREGRLPHTRLIFVLNTRLTSGPLFGHYPNSLEKGEPIESRISVFRSPETHGYDLLAARPLPVTQTRDYLETDTALPPCGGRIYAFYPDRLGPLTVHVPANCEAGSEVEVVVQLRNSRGEAFKGCVPLRLDLIRPDGQVSDQSHYNFVQDGKWRFQWTIPVATPSSANAVLGDWAVRARELASGQTAQATVRVAPRDP